MASLQFHQADRGTLIQRLCREGAAEIARRCGSVRTINSTYRTPRDNDHWGGALGSMHMLRILVIGIVIYPMPSCLGAVAYGQSVDQLLGRLQSASDTTRANALFTLLKIDRSTKATICTPSASRKTRKALIEALERENNIMRAATGPLSETEADEYWPALIGCVGGMRDPKALNALLATLGTGGIASGAVIALGDTGVTALAHMIGDTTVRIDQRHAALMTLGRFVNGPSGAQLSTRSISTIRAELLQELENRDAYMRAVSINSLSFATDSTVRRAIAKLASTDTATRMDNGHRVHFVRRAAEAWLKQDAAKRSTSK